MKINQLKSGVILSYATQLVHILSGLLYTPIMLRLLGQSEYGLYQLVYSVVSYLSLLSFGFASSYMRFYSRYKANDDKKGISRLNGMFMTIFSVIALVCILCGIVLTVNADNVFGSGLTAYELDRARILLGIMVINMALSFINSVFTSYITAHERFFFQRIIEFLRALFNPFLTLPLLIMGFGSVGMVTMTTILTVVTLLSNILYCFKKLNISFSFKGFSFSLLKEMWVFTFFIFINMIVDQFNWNISKFLLGRMMGTAAVAVYGIAGQLNSMYISFSSAISGVFIPKVNFLVAKENDNIVLTKLFSSVGRIQFIVLGLVISGFVVFGKSFIGFWAGEGYENSYVVGLLLMLPATIPLVQNLGMEIQRAKNMHKARSVVYLFIAVCNVFISIPCIKLWGEKGAAIGTAVSLLIGNGLFMNWYYHFRMGLDMAYFWKEILKFIPGVVIAILFGTLIIKILPPVSFVILFAEMLIYCTIYTAILWKLALNSSEKEIVLKPLKKAGELLCKR